MVMPPEVTYAYLDPISGSIILQALIAGVLGAILSIKKVSWAIRAYFSKLFKRDKQ